MLAINLHYGFQCAGAHFIDFAAIRREPDERPEDLYHRLMVFTDNNLHCNDSGVTHTGAAVTEDEELTPSLENFVVLQRLCLIYADLPTLPAHQRKSCPCCKCAGRPDNRFLNKCTFLPQQDKMFMARSRHVVSEQNPHSKWMAHPS